MKAVIDIYVETKFGMVRHMSIATFLSSDWMYAQTYEQALQMAAGEVAHIMLDLPTGRTIRVFNSLTLNYTEYEKKP